MPLELPFLRRGKLFAVSKMIAAVSGVTSTAWRRPTFAGMGRDTPLAASVAQLLAHAHHRLVAILLPPAMGVPPAGSRTEWLITTATRRWFYSPAKTAKGTHSTCGRPAKRMTTTCAPCRRCSEPSCARWTIRRRLLIQRFYSVQGHGLILQRHGRVHRAHHHRLYHGGVL